ncbi:SpvB/TcaC N-terminal domain-containing protein [Spongiactinospora sp. TRM90649]|uniref:SpvB/TcaC N-terminal domain-containing protein n=1 Tax=Spongiactinospora sp. TRM90649 TaxID=3031114 RepID=UPI0023F8E53A|nr:SpvB/TcaC N-terminal domain-containing protein [Spongiactinospora sp. TRM90649]MDF5756272.1 SpvB/TcaC N-terminal domain-containing protein [Spongiactinospora sp. TRM90649]
MFTCLALLATGVAPMMRPAAAQTVSPGCAPGSPASSAAEAARPAYRATAEGGTAKTITYDDVRLEIGAKALGGRTEIGITPLAKGQLPVLGAGMENVTEGPRAGYRFTPTPFRFEKEITISLPYDAAKLTAAGLTPQDVRTFYFDERDDCWRALTRVGVDTEQGLIVSRTDHFTDMVNATVSAPEGPDQVSFDPTRITGIQAADPSANLNQIAAPTANELGEARLSYPIELPGGRADLEPSLAVEYSSAAVNGWMGVGWDLSVPSISIDTRWGVPRYDARNESETYLFGGEQLTPVAHRGAVRPRTADKVFRQRVEGRFARIVRKGDSPKTYTWEVTEKSGTHRRYGGEGAVLADDAGNVFSWALREVRDPNGNTMRYQHTTVEDTGVPGGSVAGRALYPKKITYTGRGDADGPYSVTFVRDRELAEERRSDVSIDALGGFKRVVADLLRRVEVRLGDRPIRRYDFGYTQGAFQKTLLKTIQQYDAAGKLFNTHELGYFDDIRDATGKYTAFQRVDWSSPDDDLSNRVVNGVRPGAGEAGALNGNTSRSAGGHLYVGWGASASKSGSVGVKAGFGKGSDEGLLALVDVDGDTLPDKVFKGGGGYVFRKNLSRPGGEPRFAAQTTPLRNLPGIFAQSSSTRTIGVEAYPGAAVQLDHVDTISTTNRYFTDVNADGVVDLVNGENVLFGRVGADGVPVFGAVSDTPVPIGASKVDAEGLLSDYSADIERRKQSFPLVDTLRRWTAPYDGTVSVTGAVRLAEVEGELPAFARPDGVRVAVQHEDSELWSARITDHTEHTPQGVDAVQVGKGDHLYFRVGSVMDGAADRVTWNPKITYTGLPETADANGLPLTTYTAADDFTLAGRAARVTVPRDGTLTLGGALTKSAVTTDDLTVRVTRAGETVFEKRVEAAFTGEVPVAATVPVTKGQVLAWRVQTDSPIDVTALTWTPTAAYAETSPVPGEFGQEFSAPYDISTFTAASGAAPPRPYTVSTGGTLTVTPRPVAADGATGQVVFTVKRRGALLAKQAVTLGAEPVPIQVEAATGDGLFFDFSTAAPGVLTGASVLVGEAEAAATVHSPEPEGVYGRPYRGWAYAGYNGNGDRATRPIRQGDLEKADDVQAQLPQSVDPERDRAEFEQDPKVTPPNAVLFVPQPDRKRWASGEDLWISGGTVTSSRLGGQAIGLPAASDVSGPRAVPRMSRSQQISVTGGVGGGVGTVGGSVATGTSRGELDFIDMNADGFPDVLGPGGIQYTGPSGVLGETRGDMPGRAVRTSKNVSGNANAGSAARTITTGRGEAAPGGTNTANTSASGNDMPPLGIGGNLGSGTSDAESDLLDINGDGLPDRVYENGRAALNLGYRFAAPEPWPGGPLNDGSSDNTGVNIGFNTDFYGFAGGASLNQGDSSTSATLADVNGDGLADRVFAGSPIRVAINTGSGFAAPVEFGGSLSGVNADVNARLGAGVYFTISIPILFGFIIVNPGADTSTGASRAAQMLRDINGDGFADHLASSADDRLTVAANQTGRTNLLRSVERPLGSAIELDYTRDGNTYDQPGSRYVLSSVKTDDGLAGDGADVQHTTFGYAGGVHDRLEREFTGYATVKAQVRYRNGGVYRTITSEYDTGGHYTRGLVTRVLTADGQDRPFTETLHTYELRDVATGEAGDGDSTTAAIFPMPVRKDQRWYEGQNQPGKQTRTEMVYDGLGNVTKTTDQGESGVADDVVATTGYADCADAYIVGVANRSEVRGGGRVMRRSEATVDCATGNVTQHRARLDDAGPVAVTDATYHPGGTLATLTGPVNHRGQRYQATYGYDEVTGTYVTSTKDSYGYESSATYDLRFGEAETSVDINGQRLVYAYDDAGRVATVTGPHDHGAGRPTIAFDYHPEAAVPYATTRHLDRAADGSVKADTIDTVTFTDGLARVVQTKKDARIGGVDGMTVSGRMVFDEFGRTSEQYYPLGEPKGAGNVAFNPAFDTVRPTTNGYDVLDRLVRTVLPDRTGSSTAYGFGADRSGTRQLSTAVTDAEGNTKTTYTDVREQITSVREPSAVNGGPPIWTGYTYDPLGQLTRVTDDKNNHTISAYDGFGRRTTVTSPDSGRTSTAYDLAGNTISKITANLAYQGKKITYGYDFNRLVSIDYPIFQHNDVRYTYGGPGAQYNTAGRLAKIEDAGGVTTRRYGPLGEIALESKTLPGPGHYPRTFTTGYSYDSLGRVLQLTYPDGEVLSYGYDSGGQVISATGVKGSHTYSYLRDMHYDEFEQRTRVSLGNGTTTTFTYDAADRSLALLNSTLPTGYEFQHLRYGYDDVGNITRIQNDTDIPGSSTTPALGGPSTQTFAYDNLYRLTQAGGQYTPDIHRTDTYASRTTYDTIHNIVGKQQRHAIVASNGSEYVRPDTTYSHVYGFGSRPHAPVDVGPQSMRYDHNGNLVDQYPALPGKPRRQLIWDEDNRLACSHDTITFDTKPQTPAACDDYFLPPTVRFTYDSQGQRVVKDGHQTTLYPNQNYTTRNLTDYKHVFIGTTRIATKTARPSTVYEKDQFFYHGDQIGSTTFGTDGGGRLAEHLNYFPSGETWIEESPGRPDPYQFTGKELDPETGYYYHGARYYDPRLGLWKSADPIIGDYLDGQGNDGVYNPGNLNLYGYGYNNPVQNTDPDGNLVFLIPAAILVGKGVMWGMTAYAAYQGARSVVNTATDIAEGRKTWQEGATEAGWALAEAGAEATLGRLRVVERTAEWVGNTQVGRRATNWAAEKAGDLYDAARQKWGRSGGCLNSFTPGTGVLMADGTAKPIEEVELGDEVLATDPETDRTEAKAVTDLILGEGDKDLVEISVDIDGDRGDRTADITATDGHPFWVAGENRWVDAGELKPGMWFRTSTGAYVRVDAVSERTAQRRVHNLTVEDIHTFYVLAGTTPILVHNSGPCPIGTEVRVNSGGLATLAFEFRRSQKMNTSGRNVAVARVSGSDKPIYGRSGDGAHSEDEIIAQLKPGQKILELYSERQPCPRCNGRLGPHMADDAAVTWSVPWGDPATEVGRLMNSQSNERLREMLARALGYKD